MKKFKTATDGTVTTSATRKIQLLCTMLLGEAPREFDDLVNQVGSTTSRHIKFIKEVLLGYFFHQHTYQAETRDETCNTKTLRYPVQ